MRSTPQRGIPMLVAALVALTLASPLGAVVRTAAPADGPALVAINPVRVWDSRPEQARGTSGVRPGAIAGGRSAAISLGGVPGIPAGARAVVLTITATGAAGHGHLTAWPCGSAMPRASSLNFAPGESTANQVTVAVDPTKRACLYASAPTHVVVDANAFVPARSPVVVRAAVRVADTRAIASPLRPAGVLKVQVGGTRGFSAGAGLALVNVTATAPAADGYFTLYPCTSSPPTASALNFSRAENRANAAWVRLDGTGAFCLRSSSASHAVVDVTGWAPMGSTGVVPVLPNRVVDTRQSAGIPRALAGGAASAFDVAGLTNEPQSYRGALLLNVTATGQAAAGYVTVWPCSSARPHASNLNFAKGRNRAASVVVAPGSDGRVCVYSSVPTHLVVDMYGFVNPPGRSYSYRPAPLPQPTVAGMTATEMGMLNATNALRAKGRTCGTYGYFPGRGPLTPSASLALAAQRHSDDMAVHNFFSHLGTDGSRYSDRIARAGYAAAFAAENIAAGYASASAAAAALIASPLHCRNMMDPRVTQVGIGYAANSRATHHHYWTQEFGRPK